MIRSGFARRLPAAPREAAALLVQATAAATATARAWDADATAHGPESGLQDTEHVARVVAGMLLGGDP